MMIGIGVPVLLHGLYNSFNQSIIGLGFALLTVLVLNLYLARSVEFEEALNRTKLKGHAMKKLILVTVLAAAVAEGAGAADGEFKPLFTSDGVPQGWKVGHMERCEQGRANRGCVAGDERRPPGQ
jgi:hypothetical protein